MPVQEYICKECECVFSMSGTFEMFLSYTPECPECKSPDVRKKIFAPAIFFKGNGFYKNDQKKDEK